MAKIQVVFSSKVMPNTTFEATKIRIEANWLYLIDEIGATAAVFNRDAVLSAHFVGTVVGEK